MSASSTALVPYKPVREHSDEETRIQKTWVYWLTRPVALLALYAPAFKSLYSLAKVNRALEYAREFLSDIGGHHVFIKTRDGAQISAMHFDPKRFKACEEGAFLKWQPRFEAAEDGQLVKVAGWYELHPEGRNLRELMRLPPEVEVENLGDKRGVVQCLGRGCLYEGNPQAAMTYLYRGKHVLLFNYRGMGLSEGTPGYHETCEDGLSACEWMSETLGCGSRSLVVQGFSMGSGPAVHAASRMKDLDLIIDRGFSRLSAVKVHGFVAPMFRYMAENFYPYPNEDLLPRVTGRVLIIQAEEDLLIDDSHARRLFQVLVQSRLGHGASEETVAAFREKSWVVVSGGHNSKGCGDRNYAWYAHGPSQSKVTRFLASSLEDR